MCYSVTGVDKMTLFSIHIRNIQILDLPKYVVSMAMFVLHYACIWRALKRLWLKGLTLSSPEFTIEIYTHHVPQITVIMGGYYCLNCFLKMLLLQLLGLEIKVSMDTNAALGIITV